jgi:ribosome-dependent ATPase
VPIKGSLLALTLAALLFCFATGMGLLASASPSQIAALFWRWSRTHARHDLRRHDRSGFVARRGGRIVGEAYPATHMFTISRGVFNKGLSFADLAGSFLPLAMAVPVIIGLAILLLKKQER